MYKLNIVEHWILFIIINYNWITIEWILSYIEWWIDIKTLRKNLKKLIGSWYIFCNNIWFMKDNWKPWYNKKYYISYAKHRNILEWIYPKHEFNQNIIIVPDDYNEYYVKHRWNILHQNCIENTIKYNDKKLNSIWEWNRLMKLVKWEKKWEQVRINWIKDWDLKQMIYDIGKQAKTLQMEREIVDEGLEGVENLINF